ncbi:MAG TPA: bifunctional 5,10-methylenetetrahydrofolate dehydrogenase/5,10-methenyltetrahydrofolate cyclohydrolase [Candidatus Dojkabacteria bacterium]|nr:bifunctional 5,10-methylenetetrahydrofolate dehydrogenase/5,10-methenyltetrahydrofolate cyclohydrolase [Candidatus Dojkabacteria bacterium]
MVILDGKTLANKIKEDIKNRIESLNKRPKLSIILVGDDFASHKYVEMKKKACEEVGIICEVYPYAKETKEQIVINKINELNSDPSVNGIMVQLPLPKGFSRENIVEKILPDKDVDGLTTVNFSKITNNDNQAYIPATPKGIMTLLKEYNINVKGKNVVIINDSFQIGKPLKEMMLGQGAIVNICNKETPDISVFTKEADILVVATGVINLITADIVKDGGTIIDVGINKNSEGKTVGDVDFENVSKKVEYITPVPGGIGPMTIASLLDNVVIAYGRQNT